MVNYIQSTFCVPDPVPGMASAISAWPNKHFYDMQLVDSDEVATRKLGPIFEMKVAGLWDCKTYDDFQKLVGKQANFKLQKGPLQDIGNPFDSSVGDLRDVDQTVCFRSDLNYGAYLFSAHSVFLDVHDRPGYDLARLYDPSYALYYLNRLSTCFWVS